MNKLVVIVGPSGAGKSTLAQALCARHDFAFADEQHAQRPFQSLFMHDKNYAFSNQMDYLLFRAEQERELRQGEKLALMDGGLDLDFHGFTRLFHLRGWLTEPEFDLCRRFYNLTRRLLPPPDFVIALSASQETIRDRLAARDRINIASSEDAQDLDRFIGEWLASLPGEQVLALDVTHEDMGYSTSIPKILKRM